MWRPWLKYRLNLEHRFLPIHVHKRCRHQRYQYELCLKQGRWLCLCERCHKQCTVTNGKYTQEVKFLVSCLQGRHRYGRVQSDHQQGLCLTETNCKDDHIDIESFFIGINRSTLPSPLNCFNSLTKRQADVVSSKFFAIICVKSLRHSNRSKQYQRYQQGQLLFQDVQRLQRFNRCNHHQQQRYGRDVGFCQQVYW